ncbi:MAG: type II toxin-antitoxin system RelE/ParE family toxin [bacterium]|nr:type II toxin-antitoxin system RelE/ParE family toxin [bacterium]
MKFAILYHEDVVKIDIPKLDVAIRKRIKRAIEDKLPQQPDVFGKPLRRSIKGYRKLRVGDYRVIFRIEKNKIKIFIIQHRSVIYKNIKKRI